MPQIGSRTYDTITKIRGADTTSSPFSIPSDKWQSVTDGYLSKAGGLEKRGGLLPILSAMGGTPTGIYQARKADATSKIVGSTGTNLAYWTGSAWSNLYTSIPAGVTPDFQMYSDYLIMAQGGSANPQKWDLAAASSSDLSAYRGKFCIRFKNYLFLINTTEIGVSYPYRVRFSCLPEDFLIGSLNDAVNFPAANYIDLLNVSSDEETGVRVLGDWLLCYKRKEYSRVEYTGDPDVPFVVVDNAAGFGSVAHKSIRTLPFYAPSGKGSLGQHHIFYGDGGFYVCNGIGAPQLISDEIQRSVDEINPDYVAGITSLLDTERALVYFWVPTGTSAVNNKCIVYDYISDLWFPDFTWKAGAATTFIGTTGAKSYYITDPRSAVGGRVYELWGATYDIAGATGAVTSATSTTISDTSKAWTVDAMIGATARRVTVDSSNSWTEVESRTITANTATQFTVDSAWTTTPVVGDLYEVGGIPFEADTKDFVFSAPERDKIIHRLNVFAKAPYAHRMQVRWYFDYDIGTAYQDNFTMLGSGRLWSTARNWSPTIKWGGGQVEDEPLFIGERCKAIRFRFLNKRPSEEAVLYGGSVEHTLATQT